jgi:hypothetical protein
VRYVITALYLVLTLGMAWRQRDDLRALWRWWRQGRPHDPAPDPLRS